LMIHTYNEWKIVTEYEMGAAYPKSIITHNGPFLPVPMVLTVNGVRKTQPILRLKMTW
jgi:hypothetical protein